MEEIADYSEAEAALKQWRVKGPDLLRADLFKLTVSGSAVIVYVFYCLASFSLSQTEADVTWLSDLGWIGAIILAVLFFFAFAKYQNEKYYLKKKMIAEIVPLVDPKLNSDRNSPINSKELSSLEYVDVRLQREKHSSVFCISGNSGPNSYSMGMLRQSKPDSEFDKHEDIICIRYNSSVRMNRTDAAFPLESAFEDIIGLSVTDARPLAFKKPHWFNPEKKPGLYTSDLSNSNRILEVLKQCSADICRQENVKQIFFLSFGNTRLILLPMTSSVFPTRNGFAKLTLADDILPHLQTIRHYVGLAAKLDAALQSAADAGR